jgi:hypothetical protein
MLIWPGVREDLGSFPERYVLHERFNTSPHDRLPLKGFADSVLLANARVWVLDLFFGEPEKYEGGYYRSIPSILWEALLMTEAISLRFLTKPSYDAELPHAIRNARKGRFPGPSFGISWIGGLRDKDLYPFAHDRFAIVDEELWHFGSTVGAGQARLTAASRGWSAIDTGAADFYRELWRDLGGEQW